MYNKILAPLDGSKLAECTLSHIKDIASGCHVAKVVLLTVLEPVITIDQWPVNQQQIEDTSAENQNKENQMQKNADTYLSKVSQDFEKAGIDVDTVILKEKGIHQEADVILDFAKNNNIDLIMMSTHGRSGPSRWAFGSVADRVVKHSRTPVLTITHASCRIG